MNVDSSMCASSGKANHWEQIDCFQCERHVRRLQARIVKATREGRWGKVKALQWLLTHSFTAKALAVKRVTENQGKKRWRPELQALGSGCNGCLPQVRTASHYSVKLEGAGSAEDVL